MSTEKTVARAIAELRGTFNESQQQFSQRLGTSLATVGRWECGARYPSLDHLKELWHLSVDQDQPHLQQIFADAFAHGAGSQISAGEVGFQVRRLMSDIVRDVSWLLREELTPEGRARVGDALRAVDELRAAFRQIDIEPPFRHVVLKGGKRI
jgi:transcriptional regulator with XRE-family HTH domain